MNTSEVDKYLKAHWDLNSNNSPLELQYQGETTAMRSAMVAYAKACVKASLEKAAEKAKLKLIFTSEQFATNDKWQLPDGELIVLDKESITNESNIVML